MRPPLRLILVLSVVGCTSLPATRNTPFLPAGVFGVYEDNDIGAINQSAWAFASPANTSNNPIEAARAIIALEYLSGELAENPRWVGMDNSVKLRMNQARGDVRQIVGIRPDAPPQLVVNALLQLSWNLQTGNQPAAINALQSPVFTQPPTATLQMLSHLPYVQTANLATARAEERSFPVGGPRS
jgi:hypothetical protein